MMQKKSTHAFGTIHFYRYHQIPCLVCLVSHSSKPCVGLANFEQQSVGSHSTGCAKKWIDMAITRRKAPHTEKNGFETSGDRKDSAFL